MDIPLQNVLTVHICNKHRYPICTSLYETCDAPKPGGPLTTRQPAEYKWLSGYPTPLQKIGQSLLCTGSSTQMKHLHETCPKQSNITTMIQIWIKTASSARTAISIKTYHLYPIVIRVSKLLLYNIYQN